MMLQFFSYIGMVKTKIKPILPSLREKKRYLVFEVISQQKITDVGQVSKVVWENSVKFLGQLGAAKAGLMMLHNKWDPKTQRGIIKVNHKHVDALKSALIFARKINEQEVIIRSVGVSGILNKAMERMDS